MGRGKSNVPPAELVAAAVRECGERELVLRCAALLRTGSWDDDPALLPAIANSQGAELIAGRWGPPYWARVWAMRTFLYAWDPTAISVVVAAITDEAWRVRELAGKVIAKREVGEAADGVAALLTDEIPRVRAAAAHALGMVGESEHAVPLRALIEDDEASVRVHAASALERLAVRLDCGVDQLGRADLGRARYLHGRPIRGGRHDGQRRTR
jgi:HEAT repeats